MLNKNTSIYRFIGWYFLINALFFWLLGFGYLKSILLSPSLFENTIVSFTTLSGKALVLVFTLVNYLSFMMLLAFIPAILVFAVALFITNKRLIWLLSIIAGILGVVVLLMDSHVFSMFKFHLNVTILSFIFNRQWRGIFDFSQDEVVVFAGIIVIIVMVECCVAWLVWKKIIIPGRFKTGKTIASFWLGGVLFSYFTLMLSIVQNNNLFSQQTPNLPLFNQLFVYAIPDKNAQDVLLRYSENHFAQPLFSNDLLNYPLHPMQCKPAGIPYNIILIMVDSLRFDSVQAEYMPNVAGFGRKNSVFLNHLSGGNSTQPGLFSLFLSIPVSYWTAIMEQEKSPVLIDILAKYGYLMRVIWSSEMGNPPYDKIIYRGITNLNVNSAPGDDVGEWDRHTTKEAIQFLRSNPQKPFFLNLFYDAPHGYCREQSFPEIYKPAQKNCLRMVLTADTDPKPYHNRYLNAVRFVDNEVGKVLTILEKQGYLKNSVVIFTSDHGQEFNDNHQNYWEHAGNFTAAQVHIPLIIAWPGESPRRIDYLTSSYDIVPTLLQHLFSCQNPVSDYSIGQNLLSKDGRTPFILAGSYINMGIIEPDRLTTLEASGRITITDTKAAAIAGAQPRMAIINQALALMRKYYSK